MIFRLILLIAALSALSSFRVSRHVFKSPRLSNVRLYDGKSENDDSKNAIPSQPSASEFNTVTPGTEWGAQFDEFPMDPMDAYPSSAEDAEILEAMRKERQLNNDLWQSTMMRDTQSGDFNGNYELFVMNEGSATKAGPALNKVGAGEVSTSISAGEFNKIGVSIHIKEEYSNTEIIANNHPLASILLKQTKPVFESFEWRTAYGNQIVGNAFTLNDVQPVVNNKDAPEEPVAASDLPTTYVGEVAIRDGPVRSRVRYAFTSDASQRAKTLTSAEMENKDGDDDFNYDMYLVGFIIIRESILNASPTEVKPLLDPAQGPGIYDPQQEGEPYIQLNMPGRLSLLFPRAMKLNDRNCLTCEFQGDTMRYQVDRKFQNLSGAIRTLELTEIRPQDVESYPPPFVPVELLK